MRLKTAVVFLTLSLVCLISRVSFADTLTLSGVGGQNTDGVYVDPYLFTVTGPGGTSTLVDMSCLNFDREVSIGQSWNANPVSVASIGSTAVIDGEPTVDILADAYLYNQYAAAIGNAQLTSDIQFAIWSIMDPTGVAGESGYDANAAKLAAAALRVAPTLPSGTFANDERLRSQRQLSQRRRATAIHDRPASTRRTHSRANQPDPAGDRAARHGRPDAPQAQEGLAATLQGNTDSRGRFSPWARAGNSTRARCLRCRRSQDCSAGICPPAAAAPRCLRMRNGDLRGE